MRIPAPGSETLAEVLVTGDERLRLVALAERLDHLRHAHLRDTDDAWRRAALEEAQAIYLPGRGADAPPHRAAVPALVPGVRAQAGAQAG